MSVVSYRDVWRSYGDVEALRGVDLDIAESGVFGLIGRNGAGKSTLLRMIPCLLHPQRGEVRVFDCDPWQHQESVKQRLGFLSEAERYPPLLKARDLIDMYAASYKRWDDAMAKRLIERFEIDTKKRLTQLSKGQSRLVGLLCAVCHHPELLVLDEPAAGLDAVVRRDFLQVVVELLAHAGGTVIFSSHLFSDVERIAQEIVVLHEGAVLARESLDAMRERACRVAVACDAEKREHAVKLLENMPRCVRVSGSDGTVTATFRETPDEAGRLVRDAGFEPAGVTQVNLEELFIDWTGGER